MYLCGADCDSTPAEGGFSIRKSRNIKKTGPVLIETAEFEERLADPGLRIIASVLSYGVRRSTTNNEKRCRDIRSTRVTREVGNEHR